MEDYLYAKLMVKTQVSPGDWIVEWENADIYLQDNLLPGKEPCWSIYLYSDLFSLFSPLILRERMKVVTKGESKFTVVEKTDLPPSLVQIVENSCIAYNNLFSLNPTGKVLPEKYGRPFKETLEEKKSIIQNFRTIVNSLAILDQDDE